MPLHLSPLSRRRFLGRSAALAGGMLIWPTPLRAAGADAHRFALLSDTHIDADPAKVLREVNMTENLKAVAAELIGLESKPANLLVNGDCACLSGLAGDYKQFTTLIEPLRQAGYPVHLTLGNHDDREVFYGAAMAERPGSPPVTGRHVSIVDTPRANWYLLDSLDKVNSTPGMLGPEQLKWLATALDERSGKPAIIVAHHDPQWEQPAGRKTTGVVDTRELFEVLAPRRQVKAMIFGHTHNWSVTQRQGIHLINLPPVAYVFAKGKPAGWVEASLGEQGMSVRLHASDKKHPQHGEKHELKWRG